ncbi:MAG TPA: hypothetical protein VIT46_03925 [Gaiellaceae bacterium]
MAVAYISEFPIGDRSTENYEFMKDKLAGEKIDGLIFHTAGFDDDNGVWRLVDVWETREQGEKFMERMMGMVRPEELPRPDTAAQRPTREGFYELHDLVKN